MNSTEATFTPGDVATPPKGEQSFRITVCKNCGGSIRRDAKGLWCHYQTSDVPCSESSAVR